jgi:hypothetical protein
MSERQPYSRVYWSVMDDAKFDGIREDVRLFGSWSLLLVVADMAYPAPAFIPPTVPRSAFARLVASGLIDDLGGHRFRVHGMGKERDKRSESARIAAAVRWQKNGNAESMPRRDETSKDETRRDEDARADLEAFLAVRFRIPTPAQRTFMDAYCRTFDVTGPDRAARLIFAHPDDPIGAMKSDLEAWRSERRDAARAAEVPKPLARRKASGLTGVNAELAAMFRDQEAKA